MVVEDAENGDTAGWSIYDNTPRRASISNQFTADAGSRVISLNGSRLNNAFILGGRNARSGFDFKGLNNISWKFNSSEDFRFSVAVTSTNGFRYLTYLPGNKTSKLKHQDITIDLGAGIVNGQWQTISRDLAADIAAAEPGNSIISIHGFLVRGSIQLDEVRLYTDAVSVSASPIESKSVVVGPIPIGEGTTAYWSVYDKSPVGATISQDGASTSNGQGIITLTGDGISNGFILGGIDASSGFNFTNSNVFSWRFKTSEDFRFFVAITSAKGPRYLQYIPGDPDVSQLEREYAITGIGTMTNDGTWQTVSRNLATDLATAEPGNTIVAIHGFLVRGSLQIQDVEFSTVLVSNNTGPLVSAGNYPSISVGSSLELMGTATDQDGSIASQSWSSSSGNTLSNEASFLFEATSVGPQILTFTAIDNDGASAQDTITINVVEAEPPPQDTITINVVEAEPPPQENIAIVVVDAEPPPQQSSPSTLLVVGTTNEEQFGYQFNGISNNPKEVEYTFVTSATSPFEILTLDIYGHDIDHENDVIVYVNDTLIGMLRPSVNGEPSLTSLPIQITDQVTGTNTIRMVQSVGGNEWGIFDVMLTAGCNYPLVLEN